MNTTVITRLPTGLDQRAQISYDALRKGPDWAVQDQVEIPTLRQAVLFLLVKDEADIISINLQHHYRLGFRRFFILDNNSSDDTPTIIEQFRNSHPDAGIFYAVDYQVAYYQATKMKALEQFMMLYLEHDSIKPEWVFFVDADELITCCTRNTEQAIRDFTDCLENQEIDLLVFHWVQTALIDNSGNVTQFGKSLTDTEFHTWPRMKTCVTKTAYRLSRGFSPITGNHFVTAFEGEINRIKIMAPIGFYFLHFPMRSVEHLRRKIENGMKSLEATSLPSNIGEHWRTYYNWYKTGGDAVLKGLLKDHITSCLAP